MLTPSEVKINLRIYDEDITDSDVQTLINRYSRVIMAKLSAEDDQDFYNDPLFEECLLAAIACQLTRTDIEMIHTPAEYKVGDTTLKYDNTSMGLFGNIESWCDHYNSLLDALSDRHADLKHLYAVRRHGMSSRCGWWHL